MTGRRNISYSTYNYFSLIFPVIIIGFLIIRLIDESVVVVFIFVAGGGGVITFINSCVSTCSF